MKQIGIGVNGEVIVSLSPAEFAALGRIYEVSQNRRVNYYTSREPSTWLSADLEKPLESLYEWMDLKDRALALREIADSLTEKLDGSKEP